MAALTKAEAKAEIRRLERENEALATLKAQTEAENKRMMDELDTVSTGVPDRDESEPLEEVDDAKVRALLERVRAASVGLSVEGLCGQQASRAARGVHFGLSRIRRQ